MIFNQNSSLVIGGAELTNVYFNGHETDQVVKIVYIDNTNTCIKSN